MDKVILLHIMLGFPGFLGLTTSSTWTFFCRPELGIHTGFLSYGGCYRPHGVFFCFHLSGSQSNFAICDWHCWFDHISLCLVLGFRAGVHTRPYRVVAWSFFGWLRAACYGVWRRSPQIACCVEFSWVGLKLVTIEYCSLR